MRRILTIICLHLLVTQTFALANDFVYLKNIAPGIQQSMMYSGSDNFIGRPIPGYKKPECILTKAAALQLKKAGKEANKLGYQLKVYDCYRPQRAVNAFYQWSMNANTKMKPYFYPRENKKLLFKRGYIARYSGHSRGSTVDISLVKSNKSSTQKKSLERCYDKTTAYLNDNSIDMGTRVDCLDISANYKYAGLTSKQKKNRLLLKRIMQNSGFKPYAKEWWHFTLKNEPFPRSYFNFLVE